MTLSTIGGRGYISRVSGFALASAMLVAAAPAVAQAEGAAAADVPDARDDIVVTGTRGSLIRGLEEKRNADSIVDAISAEDVGKFPDKNVAETLQRIPGVAIDRDGGEGRFVSVNGLGSEFVSVLVNGRVIANDNPDRSFSFDTLASEVVSTVRVYKSANAIVPEGGLGGTVDVITAKPFDFDGFKFAGQIGGLYEDNSNKLSPQASFLISDRFLDGRLGVLASFNYFKRSNRTYRAQNSAMIHNVFFDYNAYAYVEDADDDAFRMQDLERAIEVDKRERIGGTLAVQFDATDNLQFTVDYLYSQLKMSTKSDSVLNYFYAVQDNDRNERDPAGVYTVFDHSIDYNSSGFAYIAAERYRPVKTNAIGFNARWNATDNLTAIFDLSGSRTINNNRGRDRDYTVEALGQPGFLVVSPELETPYLEGPGLYVPGEDNQGPLRARITSDSGTYTKSENWQAKLDFSFTPSEALKLNFGASYASQRKQNEFWQTPDAIRRMYHGNATNLPIDTASIITGIIRPGNVFGQSLLNSDMFIVDGEALRAWMARPENLEARRRNTAGNAEFAANGFTWNAVKSGDSYVITEDLISAYADLHYSTYLFGKQIDIVGGLRFTRTDLTSDGTTRILVDLVQEEQSGILTPVFATDDLQAVSVDNSYSNWLPSLNIAYRPFDDVVLRLSASKTLTRPVLEFLAPQLNYGSLFAAQRTATGSNPNLKPYTSFNIDASLEWYFTRQSGIALSYFRKRIDDFIVNATSEEILDSVVNPAYQTFLVSRPRNAEKAKVDGFTVQLTHSFDFGFGFQANYTHVTGDVSSRTDPTLNSQLPGISDTANLTAFFERDWIGLRVAYNWRDSFVARTNYGNQKFPGATFPRNYAPYGQIDARLSVPLPKGFTLAFDAVNLTHRKVRSYGISESAFISYQDYGRRFTVSLSSKF